MKKKTNMKNFGGLTYVTVTNIPIKETEFGEVMDVAPRELERLVTHALIKNRVPVRGAEFRIMKSAIEMSNESIAQELGISRNTVLKWGKQLDKRLPPPYEMLIRLLVANYLGFKIQATIEKLKADDRARKISVKAA